jgi:hypothetical protein
MHTSMFTYIHNASRALIAEEQIKAGKEQLRESERRALLPWRDVTTSAEVLERKIVELESSLENMGHMVRKTARSTEVRIQGIHASALLRAQALEETIAKETAERFAAENKMEGIVREMEAIRRERDAQKRALEELAEAKSMAESACAEEKSHREDAERKIRSLEQTILAAEKEAAQAKENVRACMLICMHVYVLCVWIV